MSVAPSILSEDEFSRSYNVSKRTAQRWRASGAGPKFVRIGMRRVGYRIVDLEAWADARSFVHHADEISRSLGRADRVL